MGFNTTAVIVNDALSSIREDRELGEKLYYATLKAFSQGRQDVDAGGHCNAIEVIESHHADHAIPVLVGNNTAHVVDGFWLNSTTDELALLRALALKLGFDLHKKRGSR